ncbi:MAG TPA: 3-phosphoserine/phosphohydroxythreonine transaminase [Gammaproteobacteria bacterium]|nr:3-phosphoserine/phosphohydroxythreonine transaminase [Gammaproteobacteria bacterium]
MARTIYNFAAGPAVLPDAVLEQAREEFRDCRGSGMSAMELPHRRPLFKKIAAEAEADLRDLLAVPDDYAVLFMQGGARLQASALAMNLAAHGRYAAYINTGHWSGGARGLADPYINVETAGDAAASHYRDIVPPAEWRFDEHTAYVHYVANETIGGVQYHETPECEGAVLVTDMTSELLWRPLDVSRFGLIYAGAQKNIGPAGMTIVIARRNLLGKPLPITPPVLDYRQQDEAGSLLNTPPTWSWYIAGLVFKWLKAQGGLAAMEKVNRRKAARLYDAIDASGFYTNNVAPRARSLMNVPFLLADSALEPVFLEEAEAAGLANLHGHQSVGGVRASIYNAMPEAGIASLVEFMGDFERRYG